MTGSPVSVGCRCGGFKLQPDRRRLLADGRPQPPGHRASDVVARARPSTSFVQNERTPWSSNAKDSASARTDSATLNAALGTSRPSDDSHSGMAATAART